MRGPGIARRRDINVAMRNALERAVEALGDTHIDARMKGVPSSAGTFPLRDLAARRWRVGRAPLLLPVLAARASALEHNIEAMRRFCEEHGVWLAPHGKTTMCPQLFARQLRAGAWGMTAATVEQLQVYRMFGVPRIVFANQLAGESELRVVADALVSDPGFSLLLFVDSAAGVRMLADAARARVVPEPVQVLLELGYEGGRTGVRSADDALAVAAAIRGSGGAVRLDGIAGFEGLLTNDAAGRERARAFLQSMDEIGAMLLAGGHLADDYIVSAGGSSGFDLVVERFAEDARGARRVLLRSGCYVAHDHGTYAGSPAAARRFEPALELWSVVHSRPEPSLAYLNFGRRDAPFDAGFPVPLYRTAADGKRQPVHGWQIEGLNDQHARLRVPATSDVAVGDVVVCGVSHPCGAFDRWKLVYVVDDAGAIVDGLLTFF